MVLEDVQGRMAKLSSDMAQHDPEQIRSLHGELGRVRSLVEGALRVQWVQMRAVMALTQTYSPGGRVSPLATHGAESGLEGLMQGESGV